ncbi:MAG: M48 family metalloprotease [Alphaproteobacteria bacterium]|nr:M48 family metalloprotease [Alphaproteobacteria bacterium]
MPVPYPAQPEGVPADLATPGPRYKRHAWAATAGLIGFLTLYLGLIAWLSYVSWLWISSAFIYGGRSLLGLVLAVPALFLVTFLAKGLFYVRRGSPSGLTEVNEDNQPELIAFLHQIADEAGAPRPYKVYLSPRVNAGVFYDLSLRNLILPTHKNLEIGLGLVNVLTLDEFKAVIAHEFGHFAQRSMRVGTWVYLSKQFVGDLISRRDALDQFLQRMSYIDLRVAWIAWTMRIVVWSLRSVLDTAFRGVLLLERALSREMELQADLVSVSLTGSDSLVHALHKLSAADQGFARALQFAALEAHKKRPVEDVFAVQSRVIERHAAVIDDPDFGRTPALQDDRAAHRLFKAGLAEAPRMWQTHPPNHQREANAKHRYVPSVLDERSAWVLFQDAERLREDLTAGLYKDLDVATVPIAQSLERLDAQFDKPHLDRRYQGAYLWRPLSLHAREVDQLLPAPTDRDREAVLAAIDALYPESLGEALKARRELDEEIVALKALKEGVLQAPGGVLTHRGRQIPRAELDDVIDQVTAERGALRRRIHAYDLEARGAHLDAARLLGGGWDATLTGLVETMHYAEHTAADLADANGLTAHIFRIAVADKHLSGAEILKLLDASRQVLIALSRIDDEQRKGLSLSPEVLERLGVASWDERLEGLRLGTPSRQAFAEGWLEAMESWVNAYTDALESLAAAALEQLVATEAKLADALREGADPGQAPPPCATPTHYPRLCEGDARPRSATLNVWDRFQLADGPLAATARFGVASAVLLPALVATATVGQAEVHVHNGLSIPVDVKVGESSARVGPHRTVVVSRGAGTFEVVATAPDGREIERFEAGLPKPFSEAIYNVAGAAPLVRWVAVYGNRKETPPKMLGAPRWLQADAQFIFEEPPKSVSTKSGGATRTVISALDDLPPNQQLSYLEPEETATVALVHARWDPLGQADTRFWLNVASDAPELEPIVAERIAEDPHTALSTLELMRVQMDIASPERRAELCAGHHARAAENPDDPDAIYMDVRCMPDGPEHNAAYIAGVERFPEHAWMNWGAGYALIVAERWDEATARYEALRALEEAALFEPALSVNIARLRRLGAQHPEAVPVEDLGEVGPFLDAAAKAERGVSPGVDAPAVLHGVQMLVNGQTEKMMRLGTLSEGDRRSLMLLAVGAGVTNPELMRELRPLLEAGQFTTPLAWTALGLAVREGVDPAALVAVIEAEQKWPAGQLAPLLDVEALRADPARLDALAEGRDLMNRGGLRMLGILLLGDDAPEHWRAEARALLFAFDRPPVP